MCVCVCVCVCVAGDISKINCHLLRDEFSIHSSVLQNDALDLNDSLVEEVKRWACGVQGWMAYGVFTHVALDDEIKCIL